MGQRNRTYETRCIFFRRHQTLKSIQCNSVSNSVILYQLSLVMTADGCHSNTTCFLSLWRSSMRTSVRNKRLSEGTIERFVTVNKSQEKSHAVWPKELKSDVTVNAARLWCHGWETLAIPHCDVSSNSRRRNVLRRNIFRQEKMRSCVHPWKLVVEICCNVTFVQLTLNNSVKIKSQSKGATVSKRFGATALHSVYPGLGHNECGDNLIHRENIWV